MKDLVNRVRAGEPLGFDRLHRLCMALMVPLRSQLGPQDFEDRIHDVFLTVVHAIQEDKLREPEALPGFIRSVARLQHSTQIGFDVRHRRLSVPLRHWLASERRESPEDQAAKQERVAILQQLLGTLSERERQVLTRFYLKEESADQICAELSLTPTQFRLIKSRAKKKLEKIGAARA
jgi:RNA polymerase sigma-70 factor (ECF subfamily)